ncbi:MAG TPA: hypothetical protein VG474_04475 [Solirubrobacteraceae bacterium]|nr:hypothetical protein [Solirubrobacteraceae bacterium]
MELVAIARVLTRRWRSVAAGALIAVAIAALAAPGAQTKPSAVAEVKVLVDTRGSRTVNLADGAEAIATQANLLAQAVLGDEQRDALARAVGVRSNDLDISVSSTIPPPRPSTLAEHVAKVAGAPVRPYRLELIVSSDVLIVTVRATAPTINDALRLSDAAATLMNVIAVARAPSWSRGLVVQPLGTVTARPLPATGNERLLAIAVALAAFVLWCGAVVVLPAIVRLVGSYGVPAPGAGPSTARSRASSSPTG